MKEIARLADVSEAAVSFALNNKPGVSDQKRQQILEIAAQLNFKPRRKASAAGRVGFLKVVRHGNILNRDHDAFVSDYIYGINQVCKERKCDIDLLDFENFDERHLAGIDPSRFQGLVILGTELSAADLALFDGFDMPIVFLDTYYRHVKHNFVTMNNQDAIFDIVQHLHHRGMRRIEFVSTDQVCANILEREIAFRSVIADFGVAERDVVIHRLPSTFAGSCEGMRALVRSTHALPQALVCANDVMALGCIKALRESGVSIPDDISITGFDDLPGSARSEPPLTCYQVPKREIGRRGAELLFEAIRHGDDSFASIKTMVDGRLIVRASTA